MNNTVSEVLKIFKNQWNKQVILYGPPGTSKTYSSTIIAAALIAGAGVEDADNDKKIYELLDVDSELDKADRGDLYKAASLYLKKSPYCRIVQFHPSYSYEDFVRGITVVPVEGGGVDYKKEPKIIEKFCDEANQIIGEKMTQPIVLVIDEINRAPLASVLGELIYGLEYRDHAISTPYEIENKLLIIPDNLYIIGTMNTADRSIGSMDYAVRRRFAFVPVMSDGSAIEASWKDPEIGKKASELYKTMIYDPADSDSGIFKQELLEDQELDVNDIRIGHTYFLGKDEYDTKAKCEEYLEYRIRYQIVPIYLEYIKDGLIKRDEGKGEIRNILTKNGFGDLVNEMDLLN